MGVLYFFFDYKKTSCGIKNSLCEIKLIGWWEIITSEIYKVLKADIDTEIIGCGSYFFGSVNFLFFFKNVFSPVFIGFFYIPNTGIFLLFSGA